MSLGNIEQNVRAGSGGKAGMTVLCCHTKHNNMYMEINIHLFTALYGSNITGASNSMTVSYWSTREILHH